VLYHLQKHPSIFVIRTLVSKNIREDFRSIVTEPGNYPSLRLIDGEEDVREKLRFFSVETSCEAEIIHGQLNNRRFPIFEEILCNLSDPGFSWWLTKTSRGTQLSFTLSVQDERTVKLGPLGDQQLALRNFNTLSSLMLQAGLDYSMQNEGNRVVFGDEDALLQEEFANVFEFGMISDNLKNIFKILSRRIQDTSEIETCWFYLQELASVRRFWIQIQYDLTT
jgi:hypothetical protein